MTMQIDKNDPVSVETVNRKLESFVEVVLEKLTAQQATIKQLKTRLRAVEKELEPGG
jgi:hypothetical protein